MSYFWAHWLKPALESDPFVKARLVEVPGWQTRGRPPSDNSFMPSGIVDHHTACLIRVGHDPAQCLSGILAGNTVAPGPISQILGTWTPPGVKFTGANPDPRVLIVAAGRANHAGSGSYPWGAPSGNGSSIGIEWCGPSKDRSWPDVVLELRERVDACILRHNGWPISHVTTHAEYAPSRKIDPSGPWYGEPGIAWNRHWDPNLWRARVARRLQGGDTDVGLQAVKKPLRMLDTRQNGPAMSAGETREVVVTLGGKAVGLNITVLPLNTDPGFLTVWDAGGDKPDTSNVNWQAGERENAFALSTVTNSRVKLFADQPCHVIVDLQGVEA